jgi:type IV pilus assembly protein PilO
LSTPTLSRLLPRPAARNGNASARSWFTPLNIHFLGVAVLLLINVYLVIQLAVLWQQSRNNDANAVAAQQIALKTAELSAQPLRGLDTKLARATDDADRFYASRLPGNDSEVLTELGRLTKEHNVRLTRGQYLHAPVLAGTSGELTEMRIDASLSGDYRPLVQVINALERDRIFFLIDSVTLSGQQSGTVNLRLRLRTFLRGHVAADLPNDAAAAADTTVTPTSSNEEGAQR